jgi:hypothetical protein
MLIKSTRDGRGNQPAAAAAQADCHRHPRGVSGGRIGATERQPADADLTGLASWACRFTGWMAVLVSVGGSPITGVAVANDGAWRVGVARIHHASSDRITRSDPPAVQQPANGSAAPVWAEALALRDPTGVMQVLVTLGPIRLNHQLTQQLASNVARRHGLPREAVALASWQLHRVPEEPNRPGQLSQAHEEQRQPAQRQPDNLLAAVTGLVDAAIADVRPAEVAWTVGRSQFAVNGRTNEAADVPSLRAADRLAGPVDHDVPVLVVRDPHVAGDEGVRAVVAGYACQATVRPGDPPTNGWPRDTQVELENRYPRAVALVWVGCSGDQQSLLNRPSDQTRNDGADLAAAVAAAIKRRVVPIQGTLAAVGGDFSVGVPVTGFTENAVTVTPLREWCAEGPHQPHGVAAEGDRGGRDQGFVYAQTWRLGDGPSWVFVEGSPVVDIVLQLKAELGCGRTWVVGTGGDGLAAVQSAASATAMVDAVRSQVAATGGVAATAERTISPRPYPDHTDLTVVWDDTRDAVRPIATPADWEQRRRDILEGMQAVMGRLPSNAELGPLVVVERARDELPGCTRIVVSYSVGDGQFTPADLYLPADGIGLQLKGSDGRRPAVLALHPTSSLGKRVVAGAGPRVNRSYGIELAQRGYVVLAPDYPSFGELADYDFQCDPHASGSLAGIVSHRRGVDLLSSRPEVDAARIGAIGHSLGGHNAIFIGIFDSRVKGVVSSCGWDPFHAYRGGRIGGWAQDAYMPWVREIAGCNPDCLPFDFPEAVAALAPRGFFSASPLADHNFSATAVAAAAPAIRQVYGRLGAGDRFLLRQPDCGHDFPPATREQAYAFLDRVVAGRVASR